ncbi:H/ACA ribonucleoprotein complex subunit 2-like protein [Paramacrobiotus metropolitanus]|uniref:H/ACA ribonucleoprotein complex subunit 2-like protein n=1 Tax=Paramacrobiotus metropolitanus TaxID=2943436 RepID=UPI002445E8EB|nr:H/ACA ribonucleoprotein complex subunit 2-like protein [Paramacrobiotus metropolitanus]
MGENGDAEAMDTQEAASEVPQKASYEERLLYVTEIAKPMADKKLTKRIYKLIKKAKKQKGFLRAGLKDVQTRLRKGDRGLVVFAGDAQPIDCMCHLPCVCEDLNVPYVYTPSRQDLGLAMGTMRKVMMMLILPHEDYRDLYDKTKQEIEGLPISS